MAYWRTVLRGTQGSSEVWTVSNNWGVVGLSPDVPDQDSANGILARLLTFTTSANVPASLRTLLSTSGVIVGWRVELRSESENVLSVAEGNLTTPVAGTGTPTKTPQDALVISLRTSTPGPSGRGRMYWPALGATLDTQFALTSPTSLTVAGQSRTWLNAIGNEINQWYVSIAAAKSVALSVRSIKDAVNRNVTSLQVGSALDTQRRRRDNLLETYQSVPYP